MFILLTVSVARRGFLRARQGRHNQCPGREELQARHNFDGQGRQKWPAEAQNGEQNHSSNGVQHPLNGREQCYAKPQPSDTTAVNKAQRQRGDFNASSKL